MNGLLVVISGPSAVGKDTIIERLLKLDANLRYSVSFTTRPKRDYEVDGVHYSFVTKPNFEELVGRGEFLEWAEYNGYYYGTSRTRVEKLQRQGLDVVLKIEVRGAEQVREKRPDGVFIFIAPPSMEELLKRREERGSDNQKDIEERQRLAQWEMSFAQYYDYVVTNEDAQVASNDVMEIIRMERKRRQGAGLNE
ncbi:MAG TPA: guanylate kinase [Solirubrobacterales bacterium]|nr:guanylate kinase [Solirubrobacterales bacterium]